VATGLVNAKTTATKTREDFISNRDEIVTEYGKDQELHVILDNYSTRKKMIHSSRAIKM
jgi:hypothetical protein